MQGRKVAVEDSLAGSCIHEHSTLNWSLLVESPHRWLLAAFTDELLVFNPTPSDGALIHAPLALITNLESPSAALFIMWSKTPDG